ncbi:thiamine pyrophosphate-binding protein, partial [Eisenbergiella sp.]
MIKVSELICRYLERIGVKDVFMLSGGGIMHLVESLGNSNMNYICCHHEQAVSIAAQAYAMYKNDLSVCLATTGPGGTNMITGVGAAYMDSTPMLVITGQVKRDDFASLRNVRQFGAQENKIIPMVSSITKYAALIEKEEDILYHLQKAVFIAMHGRRGPVWLDIPLDVQAAEIEEVSLRTFSEEEFISDIQMNTIYNDILVEKNLEADRIKYKAEEVIGLLKLAKKPLFVIGHGIIASGAVDKFIELQKKLEIPVLSTWRALGVLDYNNELFFGSPGLQAKRYSNIIIQSADLVIVLGSRLDNMITAFNEANFAHNAKKVIVDIDENELDKFSIP